MEYKKREEQLIDPISSRGHEPPPGTIYRRILIPHDMNQDEFEILQSWVPEILKDIREQMGRGGA